MRRRKPVFNAVSAEVLELRQMLAAFNGASVGFFDHPSPVGAITSGVGGSSFTWGETNSGSITNQMTFYPRTFSANAGQVFSLGTLQYSNGETRVGTEATNVDLLVILTLSNVPAGTTYYTLGMSSTPNTGDPDASADFVFLGSGSAIKVTTGGKSYLLEILGFGYRAQNGSFQTIPQFRVREQQSATAELLARFALVPDLSPIGLNAPERVERGGSIAVVTNVKNYGSGASGPFSVTYAVTKIVGGSIDAPELLSPFYVSITKPSIKAGSHLHWTQSFRLPTSFEGGSYYVAVSIDDSNLIGEADDSNNVLLDTTPVTVMDNRIADVLLRNFGGDLRHRDNIQVSLRRITPDRDGNPQAIERVRPSLQTWVVIHGREPDPNRVLASADFYSLAAAIDQYKPGDQVLVLDWTQGASDNHAPISGIGIGFDGAAWIPAVASWASTILKSLGVRSSQLYLVGHSWGSFVAYEMARAFPDHKAVIVALDPAREATEYDDEAVNFDAVTKLAWAFYGGRLYGSPERSSTANRAFQLMYGNSFVGPGDGHWAPVYVFESLVRRNNVRSPAPPDRAKWFSLSSLESGTSRPWRADAYSGIYEGVFTVQNTNNNDHWGDSWEEVASFQYKLAGNGQERVL